MGRATRSSDGKKNAAHTYGGEEEEEEVPMEEVIRTPARSDMGASAGGDVSKSGKGRRSARRSRGDGRGEKYDHTRFLTMEENVGKILQILHKKDGKKSDRQKVTKRKRSAKRRGSKKAKRRRVDTDSETDSSDSDSDDIDSDDGSGPEDDDGIKRIEFDMETMTGKPSRSSKSKCRAKLKYGHTCTYPDLCWKR